MAWAQSDGRTQEPGQDAGEEYSGHREGQVQRGWKEQARRQGGAAKGRGAGCVLKNRAEKGKEAAKESGVTEGRQSLRAQFIG